MFTPMDALNMRGDMRDLRMGYRETTLVYPTVTSGSNYEAFTDAPYDVTGAISGQYTATYTTYRAFARVKIIKDTTLLGLNQVVPGLEVGDYLLYFRDEDKDQLDRVVNNQWAYLVVDGVTLRPWNTTLDGVGKTFDVYVHAKKYSPKYRKTGT